MSTQTHNRDLPQTVLGVLLLLTLLVCSVWIIRPFILSAVWAGVIVTATWPLFLWLRHRMGGRRLPAILVMMLCLCGLVLLPMVYGMTALSAAVKGLVAWLTHPEHSALPAPDVLLRIPVAGHYLYEKWMMLVQSDISVIAGALKPWLITSARLVTGQLAGMGMLLVNSIMMLAVCLLLYFFGERVAQGFRRFAFRLARSRGEYAVELAGKTIQAVATGVVLTAVLQSVFAGIGMFVCGVPAAAMLAMLIFVLCLVQLGPVIVMLPAVAWLFWSGENGAGSLLLAWTVVAGGMDNIIKPLLMNRGSDTSLLLIMAGVTGGLLAWGVIGLFIGPVLLAVSWRLIAGWVNEESVSHHESKEMKQ